VDKCHTGYVSLQVYAIEFANRPSKIRRRIFITARLFYNRYRALFPFHLNPVHHKG